MIFIHIRQSEFQPERIRPVLVKAVNDRAPVAVNALCEVKITVSCAFRFLFDADPQFFIHIVILYHNIFGFYIRVQRNAEIIHFLSVLLKQNIILLRYDARSVSAFCRFCALGSLLRARLLL